MTKTQALHRWMEGWGIKAFSRESIPEKTELPYLTYDKGFSPDGYASTVHIFYRTTSELIPDNKVEEICNSLRRGGVQIPCDGGQLWLTLAFPEWYSATDTDATIKHRVINLTITDFTI